MPIVQRAQRTRLPCGQQYCYYAAPNADRSTKRVDIASNGFKVRRRIGTGADPKVAARAESTGREGQPLALAGFVTRALGILA
jgi:hypothetical protein